MALCGGKPNACTILIIFVLYFFTLSNISFGTENLIYTKLCYQIYHNYSLCNNQTFVKIHPGIQEIAAKWMTFATALQMVPAIISNIALSSYCDQIAHKMPIVLTAIGALLPAAWLAVCSHTQFISWPLYPVLLASLIAGIFGSYALLIMAGFSYVSLITVEKNRPFLFALLESSVSVGSIAAQLSQGPFITNLGMFTFFLTTAAISLLLLLFITFIMNDIHKTGYKTTKIKDLFKCKSIFEAAMAMFKHRPNRARSKIHLSIAIFFTSFWGSICIATIQYLYLTKEIGLSLNQYSLLVGLGQGARTVFPPLVLLLLKRVLKMKFLPIVMIGSVAHAIALLSFSLFANSLSAIVGFAFASLQPIAFAMTRNYQSTIMSPNDVGKLFAYEGILQVTITFISSLFSRTIYMYTLEWWAGATFAIASAVAILGMVLVIILEQYVIPNSRPSIDARNVGSEEDLRPNL